MIDVRDDGDVLVRQHEEHAGTMALAALTRVFARGTAKVLDMVEVVFGSSCLYTFVLTTALILVAVFGVSKDCTDRRVVALGKYVQVVVSDPKR